MQHHQVHAVFAQVVAIDGDQQQPDHAHQHRRDDQLPRQAGKIDHRQAGGHDQQGGPQIRLFHDQPNGDDENRKRDDKVGRAQGPFAALEPPGQHQRHRNLQQLTGLDDNAQVHPALRAFLGDTKQGHRNQQRNAQAIQRQRKAGQPVRRDLRDHQQDAQRQQHVAAMVGKAAAMVESGGIHGRQSDGGQHADDEDQWPVITAQHRQQTLEQIRFIKNFGHGRHYPCLAQNARKR